MSYYSLKPLDPFLSSPRGRGEKGEGRGRGGERRGERRGKRRERGEGRGEKGEGRREKGERRGERERGEGRKGEGRKEGGGGEGRGEKGEGRREGGAYFYTPTYIDLPYSTLITGCSVIQFLWVYSGPNQIIPPNCCRYYYVDTYIIERGMWN